MLWTSHHAFSDHSLYYIDWWITFQHVEVSGLLSFISYHPGLLMENLGQKRNLSWFSSWKCMIFSHGILLLHQRVICFATFWEKDKVIMDFEFHLEKVAYCPLKQILGGLRVDSVFTLKLTVPRNNKCNSKDWILNRFSCRSQFGAASVKVCCSYWNIVACLNLRRAG